MGSSYVHNDDIVMVTMMTFIFSESVCFDGGIPWIPYRALLNGDIHDYTTLYRNNESLNSGQMPVSIGREHCDNYSASECEHSKYNFATVYGR